jgi:tRNA/rRNA methyltransferase
MTKKIRAQDITFILVRPRYPGNIGSVARALKNMGFAKLSIVRPSVLPIHPEARRLAVGAEPLLRKTKVFQTVEEATRGLHFLVGTSRRTGKYRKDFVLLPDLKECLPAGQKIGILFGAEERGLTNRELSHCHLVATIPANPDFPSLNLAQAVMVVAYQLHLFSHGINSVADKRDPSSSHRINSVALLASTDKIEGMYQHLEKMLDQIGFFPHKNAFHMMRTIRQLFGRTGLTEREVRIVRGICRQVLWSTSSGKDSG